MSIRKRNEFLEGDESEYELDNEYASDAAEESRGAIGGRASKRRRLESISDDEVFDGLGEHEAQQSDESQEQDAASLRDSDRESEQGDMQRPNKSTLKPSTPKQVAAAQKAARRSGIIYISRVPPFMKPQTLKHFLEPRAPKGLGRVFLTPEDQVSHTRRVKSGGNKKKSFTDGWVEFASKREAKAAAEILNGNIIGGKKGNFYHDDLWSMKYLKGFKWSHLTEQIANENAERAARMREEVRKTRKENKAFLEDVERGKMLDEMESKLKAKRLRGNERESQAVDAGRKRPEKQFRQKAAQRVRSDEKPSEQANRMQKMIFG